MRAKQAPKVQAAPLNQSGFQHTLDGKIVKPPAAMPMSVVAETREAGMALASAGGRLIMRQQMEKELDKRVQEVITDKVQTEMAEQIQQIQLAASRQISSGLQAFSKRQDEHKEKVAKLSEEVGKMKVAMEDLAGILDKQDKFLEEV